MVEEEKKEEISESGNNPPKENNDEGSKSPATDILGRADEAAKRLKEENDRFERLIEEQKQIEARRILGGQTQQTQAAEVKEETPAEYKKRVLSGNI